MVDLLFSDSALAALYDLHCPTDQRGDFGFYLPLVMAAESVLDVGCGTGTMLHMAREAGHTGRLCGLDPAAGMLEQARKREDIEWIAGDLGSVSWDREFDLIVMTGHAFQVFLEDDELRAAFVAIRSALTDSGRFGFETRNPLARAWETWTPDHAVEVVDAAGSTVRIETEVKTPVSGEIVSFTHTYTSPDWNNSRVSRSSLRFLDAQALGPLISGAGLEIEEQFGDWDHSPVTEASPEIITIARRISR